MQVVIVRHGEAVDPGWGPDARRELTVRGRRTTAAVGRALAEAGLRPTALYTSPLLRAQQTAEILARSFGWVDRILSHPDLVPGSSTARAIGVLDDHGPNDTVLLVSHEPTVSIASRYLGQDPLLPLFRTSEAVLLETEGSQPGRVLRRFDPSTLRWVDAGDARA